MTFVNVSLLAGAALVAIPIVLHLILRQRPKPMVFPALRFIQQRHETNRRRLKLRHWLLLLLRCALIAILALLLASPSVASTLLASWILVAGIAVLLLVVICLIVVATLYQRSLILRGILSALALALFVCGSLIVVMSWSRGTGGTIGDQEAPVSAALIFDVAPRMLYRHQNQTRLEQSQEIASWLLSQLPSSSEIMVVDTRQGVPIFLSDLGAAQKQTAALQVAGSTRNLPETVSAVVQSLEQSLHERREVYVFSDLSREAWKDAAANIMSDMLSTNQNVHLFVIDVGVSETVNFGLGEIELAGQSLATNSPLRIRTELIHTGPGGKREVELRMERPTAPPPIRQDGKLLLPTARIADRANCELGLDGVQSLEFQTRLAELGTYHGSVKVLGTDGLEVDDIRFFTVEVRDARRVLIASGVGATPLFVSEALAPREYRESRQARFQCDEISLQELEQVDLSAYAAVCLLDPTPLTPNAWQHLVAYVAEGRGLGVFLGRNARPVREFMEHAVTELFPIQLRPLVIHRPEGEIFLAAQDMSHPVLAKFRAAGMSVPWHASPVFRHWAVEEIDGKAQVIATYNNNRPAIIEQSLGRGRVLITTTPWSDAANRSEPWNLLPVGSQSWPFLVLTNEMMLYLVADGNIRLNFHAGEKVVLSERFATEPDRYRMFTPDGTWEDLHQIAGDFVIRYTEDSGNYRLVSEDGSQKRGFSVNYSLASTDLQRIDQENLDQLFGDSSYKLVRTPSEIQREQGETRMGSEFYPYLALLLVVVLGLEHTLANRFYRHREA
ncbi:MAG: hypothetical protein CMJ62_08580 [Planctomycetaceae bacterium]|nr:hypothetical protein [Planctomycetaceae bacterium]